MRFLNKSVRSGVANFLLFSLFLSLLQAFLILPVPANAADGDLGSIEFTRTASPNNQYIRLLSPSKKVEAPGTADFTYEWWFRYSDATAANMGMFQTRNGGIGADGIDVTISSGKLVWGSGSAFISSGQIALPVNQWNHIAFVRTQSTNWVIYLNGVSVYNASPANVPTTSTYLQFGQKSSSTETFSGKIANFRYVKDVAVYTGNFTVPTSELRATQSSGTNISAITGSQTKLLLNMRQGPKLIVDSISNRTLDKNGTISGSTDTPFTGAIAAAGPKGSISTYTASNISPIYGEFTNVPGNTQAYTVEFWFYTTTTTGQQWLFAQNQDGASGGLEVWIDSGNLTGGTFGTNYSNKFTNNSVSINTWHHLAIGATSAGVASIYLDGNKVTIAGFTPVRWTEKTWNLGGRQTKSTFTTDPIVPGGLNYPLNGYVADFRYVLGTQLYQASFTPPTTALTAISGTQLLLSTLYSATNDRPTMLADSSDNSPTLSSVYARDTIISSDKNPYSYAVTYNANTGSGTMSTQAITDGTPFQLAENGFTKTGYVFDGWYTNSGGTGTRYNAGQSVTLYVNQTYYAKWIVASRYITYAANGGSGSVPTESPKVAGGTFTVAAGTGLTRTGYSFADWTDGSNTVIAGSTYTVPSGNVTLTAQWTAQVYTITYNSNNATTGTSSRTSDSFTYGGSGIALPTVGTRVRTGYTFGGWSATADGSALTGNYTPTQSVTLYARWSANTYTTTYNTNGGSGSAPANSSYTAGGAEFVLPDGSGLTKSGYDFAGWSTTTTGSALSGTQTNTADQILYARWTVKSITATYAKGTASASTFTTFPTSASGNYGTTITLDATVDASVSILGTTYIFQGWSDGTSTYQKGDSYLLGASNVTLTAQWVAIYGVRYSLNGGTAAAGDFAYDVECTVGDNYCTNGQAITSNATPTRTGYTFTGWKDQSNNSIAQAASFTVSGTSYLLYAQWSVISRSITYALSGGSGSTPTESNKTISQSFTISATSPTKSGYTFSGWSDGTLVYGPSANYVVGSANVTLTAQWSAISYTVTYDTNRGTSTTPTQAAQTIGQTFAVAAMPTRAGYTFGKWNDGTNNFDPAATYTMPAANVVLTATWSTTSLTITYSVNSGSSTLPTESNKTIGNTFVLAEAATRASRTFLGWSDGTTTYRAGATYTVGGANVTLTAQWSGTLFSVTYASGGATSGSVPTEVDKEAGTYVTLKAHTLNNLAKTASTFAGWSDGSVVYQAGESYLMSSTAVTLTATWSRSTYTVTYAFGGGSGTLPTQADVNSAGSFTIASDSGLTKSNATFAGWSDGTTTRQVGATYSNIATDVTLTAIWSENASSGGSYDPAPNWSRDQVSNNPSQISIQVEKNNGLNKVSWSSSQPVNIIVTNFNGSKKVYENLLTAIDLPNPKPGESAEVIITSGSDQSLVYDRKTIYEAPLPVQSLEVKQVASRTLYATWKPASTIQSYKIVITPAVGAPIVIETKDPQFKIQTAPNLKFVFEVIAVGAGELESNAINKTAFVSKGKVVTSLLSINQPKSSKLLQSSSADKLTTFAATLEPVSSVLCTGAATSKAGISSALAAASKVCAQLQKANPEVYVKSISKIAPVSSNSKLKSNYVVDISIVIKPIT